MDTSNEATRKVRAMTATPAETTKNGEAWEGFKGGLWRDAIDVRDFIQQNYTPYEGDDTFLAGPTERTTAVWKAITDKFPEEREKGVYDVAHDIPSTITAHAPGYIDRDKDLIVGLQTDAPLKRAIMPYGGWRMVAGALETYGYPVSDDLEKVFTEYRKTHNAGVFDAYTPDIRAARKAGIVTGLPDAYGRGRIIGDYRRVALYGVDRLISFKKEEKEEINSSPRATVRWRRRSACARSSPSRSAPSPSSRRWPPPTGMTSPARPRPAARPSSGCTSPTWPP